VGSGSGRYARGDNALGMCERCSKKMLLKELTYDGYYKDLLVCPECWDPYHPQERLPEVSDPVTLRDPTGDPDKAQANVTHIPWPPWQPLPAHAMGTPTGGFSSGSFNIYDGRTPLQLSLAVGGQPVEEAP